MIKQPLFSLIAVLLLLLMCNHSDKTELREQGLIGAYYGNADLTRIKESEILSDLDRFWDEETGHGSAWSGKYEGYIIAPSSGEVNFHLKTNKRAILKIDQKAAEAQGENSSAQITVMMEKDKSYPIMIRYFHPTKEPGFLRVTWSWDGQEQKPIPPENLFFTEEIARNWIIEPDPESVDRSQFIIVPTKNVVVYYEPGRFCGWPANNGIWNWDDEIVVGFTLSYYQEKELHHSKDETRPSLTVFARSNGGGETWSLEDPDNFVGDGGKPVKNETPIHFNHPDFALRCLQNFYYYSYDRCRTWNGPYLFPDFGEEKLTSRTDYVVNSDKECLLFFSAEEEKVQARNDIK